MPIKTVRIVRVAVKSSDRILQVLLYIHYIVTCIFILSIFNVLIVHAYFSTQGFKHVLLLPGFFILCFQRIDMVPELLSSNLCSLRSNVDRYGRV